MNRRDEIARRALALFDAFAEMAPAQRAFELDALFAKEPALARAVQSLLRADADPRAIVSPLEWAVERERTRPAVAAADAPSIWPPGTRLGPWCVDGVIGIGGMGVVHAGHRADGWYERRVAIKTIRPEMVSPALVSAFGRERTLLARLEHPAIVALLDAGVGPDAQPWLAMQHVCGETIELWCDRRGADLRTRVRLIADVCSAVGHAHARGVLHQDIKPSNMLVTEEGRVKLLDFGLAAMLAPPARSSRGALGASTGYAAPEVFLGMPPSVAMDVFSIGVVLYRLLCAEWPCPPPPADGLGERATTPPRRLAALARTAPEAVAQARGARDGPALSRLLAGDLEAIALRCVQPLPAARYPDVGAVEADLRAWLDRRPVATREREIAYRFRYRLRRHPRVVSVAMLALAVAGASGHLLWRHQREAAMEAHHAQTLNRIFERSIGVAALRSLGNAPLSSGALLDDTEARLRESSSDPILLSRGLTMLARAWLVRGDVERADRLAHEGRSLGRHDPVQSARVLAVLAQLDNLRARPAEAERLVQAGLARLHSQRGPGDALVGFDLKMQLAKARWGQGDPQGTIDVLNAAMAEASVIGPDARPALAELLGQRGYTLSQLFQLDGAERDLRRAIDILGAHDPAEESTLRFHLANTLILSGRRQDAGREAMDLLESNRRMFGERHPETGRAWIVVGKATFYLGEPDRAIQALDMAERILAPQIGADHPDLADAVTIRSGLDFEAGRLEAALGGARRAARMLERAYGPTHEATLRRRTDLASLLLLQTRDPGSPQREAKFREAEGLLTDAIATGTRQGLPMAYARDEYANVLMHLDRLPEAERQARAAIAGMERLFGSDSDYLDAGHMALIAVRTRQGRHDAALRIAEDLLARRYPPDRPSYSRYLLLELLLDNEIARGEAARIHAARSRLERYAQQHGFVDALRARRDQGMRASP